MDAARNEGQLFLTAAEWTALFPPENFCSSFSRHGQRKARSSFPASQDSPTPLSPFPSVPFSPLSRPRIKERQTLLFVCDQEDVKSVPFSFSPPLTGGTPNKVAIFSSLFWSCSDDSCPTLSLSFCSRGIRRGLGCFPRQFSPDQVFRRLSDRSPLFLCIFSF